MLSYQNEVLVAFKESGCGTHFSMQALLYMCGQYIMVGQTELSTQAYKIHTYTTVILYMSSGPTSWRATMHAYI